MSTQARPRRQRRTNTPAVGPAAEQIQNAPVPIELPGEPEIPIVAPLPPAEVKPKRVRKPKVQPSQPIDIPVQAPAVPQEPIAQPVATAKKPRKPAGPPSEKQQANRAAFKAKVEDAKRLQAATPGLNYKTAIKMAYGKIPTN